MSIVNIYDCKSGKDAPSYVGTFNYFREDSGLQYLIPEHQIGDFDDLIELLSYCSFDDMDGYVKVLDDRFSIYIMVNSIYNCKILKESNECLTKFP